MEKCRHCGAERQEGHKFCPDCGGKLALTVAEYNAILRATRSAFLEGCATRKDISKGLRRLCARSCWELTHWKCGDKFGHLKPDDEIPLTTLASLTLVRAKAEELFSLILDY